MLATKQQLVQVAKATFMPAHPNEKFDLRYPPRVLRMAVVAGFFTGPGCLAGALLGLLFGHIFVWMWLGAILGATAGAMTAGPPVSRRRRMMRTAT